MTPCFFQLHLSSYISVLISKENQAALTRACSTYSSLLSVFLETRESSIFIFINSSDFPEIILLLVCSSGLGMCLSHCFQHCALWQDSMTTSNICRGFGVYCTQYTFGDIKCTFSCYIHFTDCVPHWALQLWINSSDQQSSVTQNVEMFYSLGILIFIALMIKAKFILFKVVRRLLF